MGLPDDSELGERARIVRELLQIETAYVAKLQATHEVTRTSEAWGR